MSSDKQNHTTVDSAQLLENFVARDRSALARILTLVENNQAPDISDLQSEQQKSNVAIENKSPLVVGITGSGGAGKSTLIGALVKHLRANDLSVAVLACDPQSPLTGGALLGDRIRVEIDPSDEGIYFRSLSTRGAAGGISLAIEPSIEWVKQYGFDVIIVETVGVGQDQVAVHSLVDCLVLLVTPGTGDEIQWEKAGLIEIVDLVVVNKADMAGADRVVAQLTSALTLVPGNSSPNILKTVAIHDEGIEALWSKVAELTTEKQSD